MPCPAQDPHQPPHRLIVVRGQTNGVVQGLFCPGDVPRAFIRKGQGGRQGVAAQATLEFVAPRVEPSASIEVESIEKPTPVELQGPGMVPVGHRRLERHGVAPNPILPHPNRLATLRLQHVDRQRLAEEVQGIPQRCPSPLMIQVGPENEQHRVPSARTLPGSHDQIGEQREPLGLT